jgi:hypothetical protein
VAHGPPEPTSGRLLRVFHRLRGFACRRTRMLLTLGGDEAEPSDDREWRAEAMKRLVPRAPIAAYTRCRASSAGMGFPRAYRQRVPAQMSASPGAHLRESRRNATCCKQRSINSPQRPIGVGSALGVAPTCGGRVGGCCSARVQLGWSGPG